MGGRGADEVESAEDSGRGDGCEPCPADFANKSSDFFLLAAKTRLMPIPPATAAEIPLNEATEEEEGTGWLDLLWLEPMCWDGTCWEERELIFELAPGWNEDWPPGDGPPTA